MASNIISASPALAFLNQMLSLFASRQIIVPADFVSQVTAINNLLKSDTSGLANSILDFAISSASVDFSVETSNKTLTGTLNDWMNNINSSLRGKIPTGIDALAKEYYRERWKGSSFLVLRTLWEDVDGFRLPTKLWFASGKDVLIEDDSETRQLGTEKYLLKITKEKQIPIPANKNEKIFIQRPYEAWGAHYPIPFLIRRGVFYNLKFMELLNEKSSNVLGKALEYLMLLKKGDVDLAKTGNPDFVYSDTDLKKLKDDFQKLLDDMRANRGLPLHAANFDTEVQHLIPEYAKAMGQDLYAPIQKRILAGLGFIEVVEGITSNRKDSILNPKVFISEVESGVNDFKSLMTDILMTIIEENRSLHKKFTSSDLIQVRTSPLKIFFSIDDKDFIKSLYDRGLISKRTMLELGISIDLDEEVERRKDEQSKGLDEKDYPSTMYPPIVQNQPTDAGTDPNGEKVTPDKKGPEAKNFKNAGSVNKK